MKTCAVLLCRWIWWDPRGSTTPWASPCSSSASVASQGLLWQVSGLRHAKRANLFFQMCGICDMHAHALQMYGIRVRKYHRQTDSLYKGQGEEVCACVFLFFGEWGVMWGGGTGFSWGPPTSSQGTRACLPICVLVLAADWDNSNSLEKNTVQSVGASLLSLTGRF